MTHDPHGGIDRALATRMAGAFWIVGALLVLTALPLTPPTEAIGDAGWIVAGLSTAVAFGGSALLLRHGRASLNVLLACAYLGLAQIAVAQWLAGGVTAPYRQLYILPALQVAAVHPPRRIIPFFVVLLVAAGAP